MRPCTCDRFNPDPTAPFTPGQCRLCWLYAFDPAYRELWDNALTVKVRECRRLGEQLDTFECLSCNGRVRTKVFSCAVHGKCTKATEAPGLGCCNNCPDRNPD